MKDNIFERQSTTKTFFKFALPSVVGFLIASVQLMIDGIFVGIFVGPRGLAAINISMPYISFVMSIALMIGLGGGVITSIYLGEGNKKKANEVASFTLASIIATMAVVSVVSLLFIDKIVVFLGADITLAPQVKEYLTPFFVLSILLNLFAFTENFVRVAGKPNAIFISGVIGLVTNIILDYLFIVKFNLSLRGAGIATALAFIVANTPLFFYFFKGRSEIELCKPKGTVKLFKGMIYNGSSEMFSMVSVAIATFLFNRTIMASIGEMGVSALTIVFYINGIVNITLFGISQALQPIVSYNIGAKRSDKIKEVMQVALGSGAALGIFAFVMVKLFSKPIINMFTRGDIELTNLASEAMSYFVFAYLFSFVNIIAASFHTAIEKPLESAGLAILRSLFFIVIFMKVLPNHFGDIGIWMVVPTAELVTLIISIGLTKVSYENIKKNFVKINKNQVSI